jgi:hypothetical protein
MAIIPPLFPDAVQRDSGAPLIRDRFRHRIHEDPGSAAHHCMLRCARDTPFFKSRDMAFYAFSSPWRLKT